MDEGDDGFDAFCVEAWPRLVRALAHVVGDHGVAEELAQEALVRAHQRWTQVSRMHSPLGWTIHVGTNLARSQLRRRAAARRAAARLTDPDAGRHHDPDGADAVAVHTALGELSPPQREAVVLRYVAGLTAVETAEVLGIDATAVRARTHRALSVLRRHLNVEGAEDEPARCSGDSQVDTHDEEGDRAH